MAVGVVDDFEVIQVKEHQRGMALGTRADDLRLTDTVHHQPAVGQVGELVIKGQA